MATNNGQDNNSAETGHTEYDVETTAPVIELVELCKYYSSGQQEVRAVDRVSVSLQSGEYIALTGPSGSGKSTLMNVLGCLDTASSGHYYIDGEEVSRLSEDQRAYIRNHKIGFVFQSFNLLPRMTALQNVAQPLIYRLVKKARRLEMAAEALNRVGLGERLHHRPNELSGGQRQRVAIARALVTQPQILLADEPTGNLDSHTGREILALFDHLHRNGQTIIMVTHDADVAARCQRILRMTDGHLNELGENVNERQNTTRVSVGMSNRLSQEKSSEDANRISQELEILGRPICHG